MLFSKIITTSLFILAKVYAAPTTASNGDLTLLSSEDMEEGTLTIWGLVEVSKREILALEPNVQRRCGSNKQICSESHVARLGACSSLISNLKNNKGANVGLSPRSICLKQNGNQCCVSWKDPVGGLKQGMLVSTAQKSYNKCRNAGTVSARANDVNLHGVCTSQCLSDRPGGC